MTNKKVQKIVKIAEKVSRAECGYTRDDLVEVIKETVLGFLAKGLGGRG